MFVKYDQQRHRANVCRIIIKHALIRLASGYRCGPNSLQTISSRDGQRALRDVAVMCGNRRGQTKTELSIFHRRRSIRFRSRPRLRCSVSGSRSAQVISTKETVAVEA